MSELTSVNVILTIIAAIVIGKISLWLLEYFYRLWVYSYVPGPTCIPFIGNTLNFLKNRSGFMEKILEMSKKYKDKPFYRVWFGTTPLVSFEKADHLGALFNSSNDKAITYEMLHPWLGTGLLTSKGDKWALRRKMITPSFHFDILKDFFNVMNEHADILVGKLSKMDHSKKVSLLPHIAACTLDVICETAMGYNIDAQTGRNADYVNTVHEMSINLIKRFQRPWLAAKLLYNLSKYGKNEKQYLNILHGFTKRIIKERADSFQGLSTSNQKRIAFLDMLLDVKLRDPNSLSLDDIQEEVDTFMFEGHDTTTSGITWTLYSIATHKSIQNKLHEEIDRVLVNSGHHVTMDDLNKMDYLDCVIKESLRMFPPVPFIGRTITQDVTLDGYKLLKNTNAFVVIYEIHRDERYYPNPEEFQPERFLPENCENRHPFAYIPFSFGKRNCIGQRFAMMELKTIVASILRNFELECNQTIDDIKTTNEVVLRPENEILFTLKPRKL